MKSCDVVIVGGGLVGCSLAISLARTTALRIAILEKNTPQFSQTPETGGRPISLSKRSLDILDTLGLWSSISPQAAPLQSIQVSNKGYWGRLLLNAANFYVDQLGAVVPFQRLHQVLFEATQHPQITVLPIDTYTALSTNAPASVTYQHNSITSTLSAKLIIAADGTHSKAFYYLEIDRHKQMSDQMAVSGELVMNKPVFGRAHMRLGCPGTLALLPLYKDNTFRFIWSLSQVQCDRLQLDDPAQLQSHLQRTMGHRLGTIQTIQPGATFPIQTQLPKEQHRGSCLLLGNAAHTLPPFAAQGFNLCLRDVTTLSDLIAQSGLQNIDSLLQNYLRAVGDDQKRIADFIQFAERQARLQLPGLHLLRAAALSASNWIAPLKYHLVKLGMGY